MAQQNDQVFQLSLTEIAFTIAFILLLLLGYLVFKEQTDRKAAEEMFAKVQSTQQATAALDAAKTSIAATLNAAGSLNPDDVITKLIAADGVRAERDALRQRVEDLDAKLTALIQLRDELEKAASSKKPEITREEIESALVLQDQAKKALANAEAAQASVLNEAASRQHTDSSSSGFPKKSKQEQVKETGERVKQAIGATIELRNQVKAQLKKDVKLGQEAQAVREIVAAAKSFQDLAQSGASPEAVKKENADLRGQVVFLKNKLEARGGRDYPPCWADEVTGKVQFLFAVEVKPDSVSVKPAWPASREADAKALPGMAEILAGISHTNANFVSHIQGIFRRSQELSCRHYVELKSSIPDAVQSDRARLMVENYFYKAEVRR